MEVRSKYYKTVHPTPISGGPIMLTIGLRPVQIHYRLPITGYELIRNYPYLALLLITILSELRKWKRWSLISFSYTSQSYSWNPFCWTPTSITSCYIEQRIVQKEVCRPWYTSGCILSVLTNFPTHPFPIIWEFSSCDSRTIYHISQLDIINIF